MGGKVTRRQSTYKVRNICKKNNCKKSLLVSETTYFTALFIEYYITEFWIVFQEKDEVFSIVI
jgi:hypothetical protein